MNEEQTTPPMREYGSNVDKVRPEAAPAERRVDESDMRVIQKMLNEDQEMMLTVARHYLKMNDVSEKIKIHRSKMDDIVKVSLEKAGIPKNETGNYILDVLTGNILENKK